MHFAAGAEWYRHPTDDMVSYLYYFCSKLKQMNHSSKFMLMVCELNGFTLSVTTKLM